eukprot:6198344-Pleurochrysis_carterae.AAC.1
MLLSSGGERREDAKKQSLPYTRAGESPPLYMTQKIPAKVRSDARAWRDWARRTASCGGAAR